VRNVTNGALGQWADTPAGKLFLDCEAEQIRKQMPETRQSEQLLWLSAFHCEAPVEALSVCSKLDKIPPNYNAIIAHEYELPFFDNEFPMVISSHVHEYTAEPHRYLRELARVIEPEGQLIISGYNLFNILGVGLRHRLYRRAGSPVYPTHYLSIHRLKDWLRLLGFELEGGGFFYYLPLTRSPVILDKLRWMESAGNRWWPRASAGFTLTARKRLPGMTPLSNRAKLRLWAPAPQPALARVTQAGLTEKHEHR